MAHWLVKSEEDVYSISNLQKDKRTLWEGVRNYQARNYLKAMEVGDEVLFYHSNAEQIGIVGVAEVSKKAVPDPSQFDKKSEYFDPKAAKESPRWFCPELRFVQKFARVIQLAELRGDEALIKMELLKKGSRLSVQPVSAQEFRKILALAMRPLDR